LWISLGGDYCTKVAPIAQDKGDLIEAIKSELEEKRRIDAAFGD
jgi:hypothetical protein